MPGAQPLVELLGEGLEVDIGGIHAAVKLLPRRGVDVARCDRDVLDPAPARHLGHVDGIFEEDDRIVVGVGDRARACGNRGATMSSGEASSWSRSISRALEMSQFWQNLQVRLHPAVPKDSTGVPGR